MFNIKQKARNMRANSFSFVYLPIQTQMLLDAYKLTATQ